MQPLCTNCLKNDALRKVVTAQGTLLAQCEICGTTNVHALPCDNHELKSMVRSLIRFHYSEWHYNEHWGGEGLEHLFYANNPITNYHEDWDEDKYEEAILEFLDPAYEDYEQGISLFSGYDENGNQNRLLAALKNEESGKLISLKRLSETKNHFLVDSDVAAIISPRLQDIEAQLKSGTRMFRTRIGYEARATPSYSLEDERHYKPFSDSNLSSPPPIAASAGRMNRQSVAFLYMATDAETAIAETRPHPGHFCSVGEFEASENLRVADLSALEVTQFAESDKRLDDFLLLKTIDSLFSMPITPEGRSSYYFTQLLADCLRQLEFDAIRYKSSVGPGTNLVVFDPSKFSYVPNSARVVKISALSYQYEKMQPMRDDADYMTRPDGSFL